MTFKEAYLEKYPENKYVINRMIEYAGHPKWSDFTVPYLAGLVRFLRENMTDSSARTVLSTIKATMNDYRDIVPLPERFERAMRVKANANIETWLTEEELFLLENYSGNENEMDVVNDFLIGAWSGARQSDFSLFNEQNLINDRLVYVSVKTGIRASVPAKKTVLNILKNNRATVDKSTYNRIIKRVCRNVGITENIKLFRRGEEVVGAKYNFISSHTARRSFATNLYLRGVDVLTISRYMAHSSIEMTKRYIVSDKNILSDEEIAFFG